ncbi:MAG: DEAD/DEAH box helicase family protein [Minicystis sp.]
MNLSAGRGVAVRELKLRAGNGFADYLLFVDGKAVGFLEAKAEGFTLSGVEPQAKKHATGLLANLDPPVSPLPFLYISNGGATTFTNLLDLKLRSRGIFQVHRPETLAEWPGTETLDAWVKALHDEDGDEPTAADDTRPSSLRTRTSTLPELDPRLVEDRFLFPNEFEAITKLERSLKLEKPRALIQMATGSRKTFFAVTALYRQIKCRRRFFADRAEKVEKQRAAERTRRERKARKTGEEEKEQGELALEASADTGDEEGRSRRA